MTRTLFVLTAILAVTLLAACARAEFSYAVEVAAPDGLPWSGSYQLVNPRGEVTVHSVEHVGPHRFTVKAKSIVGQFRRGDPAGAFDEAVFRVEIYRDGRLICNRFTLTSGGEVTFAGHADSVDLGPR